MAQLGFITATRTALGDALITYAGSAALLKIFSGTKPALGGAETTKLAQLTFTGNIGTCANGIITIPQMSSDTSADATGTASWARILKSDNATIVMDMDVSAGGGGATLTLDNTSVTVGGTVAVTGGTITVGNAS
jgi:hypothetical protein